MDRFKIVDTIGRNYLKTNLENGEFSYPKALKNIGKTIDPDLISALNGKKHQHLDIRFIKGNISILVETKSNYDDWKAASTYRQLQAYVNYENVLTGNKIIAILANTQDDRVKVWWGSHLTIDESHQIKNQYSLKTFDEYADIYTSNKNDREQVLKNTYALNELLHKHGIGENIRSQFVGTCLLALKNGLVYENLAASQIRGGIEDTITNLLEPDLSKAQKLVILKTEVLESQHVRSLTKDGFQEIVRNIDNKILPFINDKSTMGQDLLNLFFTTFNKYVGKADKNQAFTPDHIVHFMCQVVGINRNSRVLDPCCGSGAFLVRAMTEAMDDCANDVERDDIKRNNIYGFEYEETAFGLSTTNMLIHSDGNSNIRQGSCFDFKSIIADANINTVLMNPPYNAQRKHCDPKYVKNWSDKTSQDPTKGLHFVHYIASIVKTGKLAVLLPMQCAIANSGEIKTFKEKMLKEHTLDAVFSLPSDMFHPGASASACCMIFDLGIRHENANYPTFFGYFKEDGFTKKKNLGRVEKTKANSNEGLWADIEADWLSLYRNRKSVAGLSVTRKVTAEDEWLAEAYMETDYSQLTRNKFDYSIRSYVAFKVIANQATTGKIGHSLLDDSRGIINTNYWKRFNISNLFDVKGTKSIIKNDIECYETGEYPYVVTSAENNGIQGFYDYFTEEGEVLTIDSATIGSCFYQPISFSASDHVEKLVPKFNMNVYIAMFIKTVIELEKYRYGYGRKFSQARIKKTKIKLPVDNQGNPDWQFMEDYIKSLPYSANI